MPRELTHDEVKKILDIDSNDITISLLRNLFARKSLTEPPKFNTDDYFKLPKSRFNTKKEVYTTIGIYIANLHLIVPKFYNIFKYINRPFDGKLVEEIEAKLADFLYNDKISTDDMADYYNRIQWLGGHEALTFLSPSITPALLKAPPGLKEKKERLFKENKKEIEKGNAIVGSHIEKELIKDAINYLKTDPGYENFESKSKININNNYKTMNIMKGPIMHSSTHKYRINSSEYNSGIKKEEYVSLADSSVIGSSARAIKTGEAGYLAKKSNQSLATVIAAPKGSNCNSTEYLEVTIYAKLKNNYIDRYIIDDGLLTLLTKDNIDKYVDKKVQMRSPMFCHYKEPAYCNVCLGDQPYKMGLENFGLAISRISNSLLNLNMKKFHDLTIKPAKINPRNILKFK
jgi:hypothetical protein